jgi:hypothetical protein
MQPSRLMMAAAVKASDSELRNVETKAVTRVGYLHKQISLIYTARHILSYLRTPLGDETASHAIQSSLEALTPTS